MEYSIKDFSDKQIEELNQCPGINIDKNKLIAEVSFMADGLFLSISKQANGNTVKAITGSLKNRIPCTKSDIKTSRHKTDIEGQATSPAVEKSCKCGCRATTFDFGEIENGKFDWAFYCNACNPHSLPIRRSMH